LRTRESTRVIFDWGGTLTRWHDVDFYAESLALAQAVVSTGSTGGGDPTGDLAERLHRAGEVVWGRSRDHQQSATVEDLFAAAGLVAIDDDSASVLVATHGTLTMRGADAQRQHFRYLVDLVRVDGRWLVDAVGFS